MTTVTEGAFEQEGSTNIPELQKDLQRKYRNVGSKVERIWRNFTQKQREQAMRETVGDVDTDLHQQHAQVVNGGPGDREIIHAAARTVNVGMNGQYAFFLDLDKDYGRWMEPNGAEGRRSLENMAARTPLVLPANETYLLISRQTTTYIFYDHLIEEILDIDSDSRAQSAPAAKRTTKAPANAMAKLTIASKPLKASIAEVVAQAEEHKVAAEDYLQLLRSEPVVLNHAVNMTNSSRPELVPDDRGRILPMITDKYISIAFFEVMCNAVKAIVTWEYIVRLVRMLEGEGIDDKIMRPLVVQELSNACHLEYRRAQSTFRRQVSRGVAGKSFRRVTTGDVSKLAIKGQPSDYTLTNPQLHYILRLCHPDTGHIDAAHWVQKLDEHNGRHLDDLRQLTEEQVRAFGDLAVIVRFMHMLSTSLARVAVSKKLGITFTGRTAELDTELAQYQAGADFGDHLVPTDNLLEPDAASNALKSLDDFMVERAGASLGSLYEDLLHECLNDVEKRYSDTKIRLEKVGEQQPYVPLPHEESKPTSFRAEQRREKAKTRPADEVRACEITAIPPSQLETAVAPAPRLKVKASTASVFDTLFPKPNPGDQSLGRISLAQWQTRDSRSRPSMVPSLRSILRSQWVPLDLSPCTVRMLPRLKGTKS